MGLSVDSSSTKLGNPVENFLLKCKKESLEQDWGAGFLFFCETGFLCIALAVLELRNLPASAS